MKFTLVDEYRYWWPVAVSIPDGSKPGKFVTQTFDMNFKAVSKSEAEELDQEFARLDTEEDRRKHQDQILYRVCCDWRGVQDDEKQEVPFTDEAFQKAMEWAWFRTAVYLAYGQSLAGDQARRGN